MFLSSIFIVKELKENNPQCFSFKSSDKSVVIDAGHGGIDGGTSDRKGLLEKNINLDVSLRVEQLLSNRNINVIMTREQDVSLENKSSLNSTRYRKDLNARKTIINSSDINAFISIHVDAHPKNPKARGVKVFYYDKSEEGEKLAKTICNAVDSIVYKDYLKNQRLKSKIFCGDYYILRETSVPGVLVEIGFVTNTEDNKLLQDDGYKNSVALAISEGVIEYIKN
ncbi:N-acetylmuramoyl-L-alanine amidase family protein [Brassicibacter mesophilus]|uniref:N-acetylmuramoyl-L-alanine amidase family protein n=1 Tax=Brassicibacter mesophilus TaxID=745119 RepID=UPI003D1A4A4D